VYTAWNSTARVHARSTPKVAWDRGERSSFKNGLSVLHLISEVRKGSGYASRRLREIEANGGCDVISLYNYSLIIS